jgi:glycosyltransferase involved in cell wall biosynthesis
MIKVLIVNSTLERSGLSNVVYYLAKFINKDHFELHLLTLSPEPNNSMWADFEALGVKLHTLKCSRLQSVLNIGSKLKNKVKEIAPNLIHTHSFRGTFLAGKFLANYKRMVTVHGVLHDNHTVIYGKFLGGFFANKELKSFKQAQARTVVSAYLKDTYNKYGEISVIPNAVPPDIFFKATDTDVKLLREKMNIPLFAKVYIVAGDLIPRKDPILVIKAFVNAQVSDAVLIVLGKGPLMAECKKVANDQVMFLGQVPNVADYYKMADFLISASVSEGQGLSVLEAAMCGLTCLVSNLPPHQEIFAKSPHQARFFKLRDELALTKLIRDESVVANKQGSYFSITDMVNQYQNGYLRLVAE